MRTLRVSLLAVCAAACLGSPVLANADPGVPTIPTDPFNVPLGYYGDCGGTPAGYDCMVTRVPQGGSVWVSLRQGMPGLSDERIAVAIDLAEQRYGSLRLVQPGDQFVLFWPNGRTVPL